VCEWLQQYDSRSAKKFPWEKSATSSPKTSSKDNTDYRYGGYQKNGGGYGKGTGGSSTSGVGYLSTGAKGGSSSNGKAKHGVAIQPLAEASKVKVKCEHCGHFGHAEDKCWKLHPEMRPQSKSDDKVAKSFAERGGHLWGVLVTVYNARVRVTQDVYLAPDTGYGETLIPESLAKNLGIKWSKLKQPRYVQGIGGQRHSLEWQVTLEVSLGGKRCRVSGLVFPQDFLEGVPTVLLGWKGLEDMEAVVSIPQSTFTCGLLGVTVPLVLLTGTGRASIAAMALVSDTLDPSTIDARLRTWEFPKVYAKRRKDCVPPRPRPYPPKSKEEADVTTWLVGYMLEDGIFEEVYPTKDNSFCNVYFNPVFVVPKYKGPRPEGINKSNVRDFYRLVLDARPSNAATADFTPGSGWVDYTPGVMQALGKINSSKPKYFMKMDIRQAFWCMEYATDDDMETQSLFGAVITVGGGKLRCFLHRKLVMGWKHSSAWWSAGLVRLLESLVPELGGYLIPYVDDILVVANTPTECLKVFNLVVYALEGAGLEIPPAKRSVEPQPTIDFLSLELSAEGWRLSAKSVSDLAGVLEKYPSTVGALRSALGVIKYCKTGFSTNKAEKSLSALLAPFNDLLARMPQDVRKNTKIELSSEMKQAWSDLYRYCHNRLHVWHGIDEILGENLAWVLMTDTSPIATSATLWRVPREQLAMVRELGDEAFQREDFGGQLVFTSARKLTKAQAKWVNFDREMYGVIRGMAITKELVMGSYDWAKVGTTSQPVHLIVGNDNTTALGRLLAQGVTATGSTVQRQRWTRWYGEIADLTNLVPLEYMHVPGKRNWLCDFFSRFTGEQCGPISTEAEEDSKLFLCMAIYDQEDPDDVSRVERVLHDDISRGEDTTWVERVLHDDISRGSEIPEGSSPAPGEGGPTLGIGQPGALDVLFAFDDKMRSQIIQLYKADTDTQINSVRLCEVYGSLPTDGVYTMGGDGLVYKLVCYRGEFRKVIVIPKGTLAESLVYWIDESYVPTLRRDLIGLVHHVCGHGNIRAALKALRRYVWWPGMSGETTRVLQACASCWETKAGADLDTADNPRAPTVKRFEIVHSDFGHPPKGLAQSTDPSSTAFLLFICAGSGFVVSSPVPGEDAGSLVRVLAEKWICYFGVPRILISDGGPAYRSRVTEMVASLLGFKGQRVLPYNPQGNGLAERAVGSIKMYMDRLPRALPWDYALALATYYHNHSVGQGSMPGPAECAIGIGRGPLQLFFGDLVPQKDQGVKDIEDICQKYLDDAGYLRFERTKVTWRRGNLVDAATVIDAPANEEDRTPNYNYVHADPNAKTVWICTEDGKKQRVPYRQLSLRPVEIEFRDQPMHGSPVTLAQLSVGEYAVANVNYGKTVPAYVVVKVEKKFGSSVEVQVYDMEASTKVFRPLYTDRSHGHFRLQPERGFRLYRVRLPMSSFRSGSFSMTKMMKIPAEVMRRLSEIGVSMAPGGN
ncbi:hypothetical protein FOL47_011290, partial [Perkinsus chesapeaki]